VLNYAATAASFDFDASEILFGRAGINLFSPILLSPLSMYLSNDKQAYKIAQNNKRCALPLLFTLIDFIVIECLIFLTFVRLFECAVVFDSTPR
jgi:hypothetical protein